MKLSSFLLIILITFNFTNLNSKENNDKIKNKISKNIRCLICQGQSVYDSEGLQGLMVNAWTDILITYANKKGMDVTKDLLHEQIEAEEEEGTFFSKLRDTIMEMRTGITADRKITAMARLDGHGYVV